jgi:hypothetical protein
MLSFASSNRCAAESLGDVRDAILNQLAEYSIHGAFLQYLAATIRQT